MGKRVFITLLLVAAAPMPGRAQESMPGAYSRVAVTEKHVKDAAAFAVAAQRQAMRDPTSGRPAELELVAIDGAEQQIVAGITYRLELTVKVDGKSKPAQAVVWWQAWRTPDPYRMTSWTWK